MLDLSVLWYLYIVTRYTRHLIKLYYCIVVTHYCGLIVYWFGVYFLQISIFWYECYFVGLLFVVYIFSNVLHICQHHCTRWGRVRNEEVGKIETLGFTDISVSSYCTEMVPDWYFWSLCNYILRLVIHSLIRHVNSLILKYTSLSQI